MKEFRPTHRQILLEENNPHEEYYDGLEHTENLLTMLTLCMVQVKLPMPHMIIKVECNNHHR